MAMRTRTENNVSSFRDFLRNLLGDWLGAVSLTYMHWHDFIDFRVGGSYWVKKQKRYKRKKERGN